MLAIEDGKAVIRNAGTAVITAIKAEDDIYNASSDSREVTVSPKELELEWSNDGDRTYDGTASAVSARPTNLVGEDICDIRLQGHEAVNAGEYTAKAVGTTNHNYCLPEDAQMNYRVLPVSVRIQWEEIPKLTYTGVDQLDKLSASWTDIAGQSHEAVLQTTGKDPLLHAGTYTVIATTGDRNYQAVSDTARDVKIAKADPVIRLTVTAEEKEGVWAKLKKLLHFHTDQKLRLTATVTGVDGKAQTGKVDFYVNDALEGSEQLEGGQAGITVKHLKLGETTIFASFTPDENSTDHNGGQSEIQICQIGKPVPVAPETTAYATASSIRVEPLSKESVELYGEAQYRIDNGPWQTEHEFSGLQAARIYTVQVRYGGNDHYAPSVAQTIYVTTMYELMIPAKVTAEDDTAKVAISKNISLVGREVHITIEKSDGAKQDAVITQDTLDQKATFSLGVSKDDREPGAGSGVSQIIFKAELVDQPRKDTEEQGD